MSPELMLRPQTGPQLEETPNEGKDARSSIANGSLLDKTREQRSAAARARVKAEMKRRSEPSRGLPLELRDRVFEPRDAPVAMPHVEQRLRQAFNVLANQLAGQGFAFADTLLTTLCQREIEDTMSKIEFSSEQHKALSSRHSELQTATQQIDARHAALQRCVFALRSAGPPRP